MPSLVEQLLEVDTALERARLPHAFGGALALAWCTRRARGTIDIDLNVFIPVERRSDLLAALPPGVRSNEQDDAALASLGQTRLWWDSTPIDVFLNTTDFHEAASARVRTEHFAGRVVPFLSCDDLAVFKAFFDRTKDWADLEEMHAAGTLDTDRVIGVLVTYLGPTDPRVERLRALAIPL